ncbi:putative ribonuclease H-like domain-containing protein [Tanacetum coccineum]
MDEFCREKGIKREYSVARTPQQNGVAERKNRTLIEAARTMLADSKLPTTFWAEVVSTACYVQNRVLIVKPHNKTPYELFRGIKPAIGFMKPFGCHVTILNTLDKLGKFDGKSDEGFFVGYSLSSKAFRVYNIRTRKVQNNLQYWVLENKPMIEGNGPKWLFDLDSLTQSMNYVPVVAGTFSNDFAGCFILWKMLHPDLLLMLKYKIKMSYMMRLMIQKRTHDDSSLQNNGTADQQVNTARPDINNTDSDKLTFQKGAFSPQWRFLIHNILHCLSPKKTAWEQFSSNIATALICLATNRKYNFSRMIFEHMVSNISSPHKFLMYPRFIQICLDMQRNQLQQHTRLYHVPSLSMKVFNNMKRPTKGFSGQEVDLFPTMLHVPEPSPSPSRITSSPSHSPEHSPSPTHSPTPEHITVEPTQPSPTHPSPRAEHHFPTPHDSPLHAVHSHGSDEGRLQLNELMNLVTKLSDRIGALEVDLKKTKKTYNDEVIEDDSSKQGRKLSEEEVQEKASTETELFIQEVTPTEVIQAQEGSEKGSDEVSTAGAKKGTASEEAPIVSTAKVNLSTVGQTVTYTRRSAEKRSRQDKGKAIMIESEPKKKSKKELEQERLSFAEAIRLKKQMNEEQRAQIARDEEVARQWDEEERQRAMAEAKSTKQIDWNDHSVIRYHTQKMEPKTVAQARNNMIKYLKNQGNYKIRDFKGMSYDEIRRCKRGKVD